MRCSSLNVILYWPKLSRTDILFNFKNISLLMFFRLFSLLSICTGASGSLLLGYVNIHFLNISLFLLPSTSTFLIHFIKIIEYREILFHLQHVITRCSFHSSFFISTYQGNSLLIGIFDFSNSVLKFHLHPNRFSQGYQ